MILRRSRLLGRRSGSGANCRMAVYSSASLTPSSACFAFTVEQLRCGCGTSHFAERQHLDFKFPAFILYVQFVACAHIARRLRLHPI